ncbi:MAG: helix-turn-helix domain-containing protein [Planctomycetota bacterium]
MSAMKKSKAKKRVVAKAEAKAAARKLTHARILLQADESEGGPGWADRQIGEGLRVGIRTIEGLRQRFVEQGLEAALERKKRAEPPVPRKLDGEQEARLVAVCCSQAPEGRRRWTLHLLADRLVELRIIDSISHETVR